MQENMSELKQCLDISKQQKIILEVKSKQERT